MPGVFLYGEIFTMFDLNSVAELETAKLKLTHPETGELIGAEIELAGASHPKRKAMEFQRARVLRARVSKKGRLELSDPVEDDEFEVDRLVACTISWTGLARDGKGIECNAGEARAIYEGAAWIRKQAVAFLEDSAGFLHSTRKP